MIRRGTTAIARAVVPSILHERSVWLAPAVRFQGCNTPASPAQLSVQLKSGRRGTTTRARGVIANPGTGDVARMLRHEHEFYPEILVRIARGELSLAVAVEAEWRGRRA